MADDDVRKKQIRERFALLCKRLGWGTRAEIARAMGWHQPDVSNWINGKRPIPDDKLVALAFVAGETVDYFTRPGEELERRDALIAVQVMEREAARLRDAFTPRPEEGAEAEDAIEAAREMAEGQEGGGGASEDPQGRESA